MTNGKGSNIVTLARELVAAEDTFNAKLAEFSSAVSERNDAAPTRGAAKIVNGKKLPAGKRIRLLLEGQPGVRMSIEQIRNAIPDAKPLTVRKTLFRLSHDVKGFKRDKKARGVYFFAG